MADLVIRNATIVDGTGQPGSHGDVAVTGDTITAVGSHLDERGRREIDADGLMVTPGFVDIHTHYDGQVTWDGVIAPSSLHGVTSIVMGNCGASFAPARPTAEHHDWLIGLLEGVEDIPARRWPRASRGTGRASPTTSTRWSAVATPSTSAPRWPTRRCGPT